MSTKLPFQQKANLFLAYNNLIYAYENNIEFNFRVACDSLYRSIYELFHIDSSDQEALELSNKLKRIELKY